MQNDRPPLRRVTYEKGIRIGGSGWFGRLLAVVLSAIVLVAAAMLSLVLLAVLFAVGTIVVGYLWWKTRARCAGRRARSATTAGPSTSRSSIRTCPTTIPRNADDR